MFSLKQAKIAGWGLAGVSLVIVLSALGIKFSESWEMILGIAMIVFMPWSTIILIKNSK